MAGEARAAREGRRMEQGGGAAQAPGAAAARPEGAAPDAAAAAEAAREARGGADVAREAGPAPVPALEVDGLSFSYGSRPILQGIRFAAMPGDFIAVLGPNGVGKSTMFKCILRFLHGYSGEVRVDGRPTQGMTRREIAAKVAYIPQSSAQVFDFTVLELVMLGYATRLPLFRTPDAEAAERALAVLDSLGIAHLAHQGCGEVSGGEYQLVLLARTLVQDARILIMDEPTANLDYGNQYRVMERIAGLTRDDFVIMMAAHDPNQVLLHANRALVVEGGRVIADGAPASVMTSELLSAMYGIDVRRITVGDEGGAIEMCVPGRRG